MDQRNAAELRSRTVDAITKAGMSCGSAEDMLEVSRPDSKIWISLDTSATEQDRQTLSEQAVVALTVAGLQLVSFAETQGSNPSERLQMGEALASDSGAGSALAARRSALVGEPATCTDEPA